MALGKFANRIVGSGEESLDQIQFNPRNWRVHPLNQQNALKGVLEEVGWVQEVIINQRTGHLVDGHLRCQLAAREGAKTIPVKYVDLSEEEEALVLSTLDPIAAMATTDKAKLDELFASIESENADVLKMLDDIAEKERLEYAKRDPVDAEPQIDRAAELNEKWQVVTGDLWQIGEHRLLCGDSTRREDVERVMAGEKADMLLNDPPYGMRLDADFSGMVNHLDFAKEKGVKNGNKYENVIGDDVDYDASPIVSIFSNVKEQLWWGADYYSSTLGDTMHNGAWLIWDKRLDESADKMYGSCFEMLWSKQKHKRDILRHKWAGIFGTEHEPQRGRMHPNQKPIELYVDLLNRYSDEGMIVVDCYAGSGTTMVACQNLNRKCRAIEISPNYCAVILERMSTAFPELEIKKVD